MKSTKCKVQGLQYSHNSLFMAPPQKTSNMNCVGRITFFFFWYIVDKINYVQSPLAVGPSVCQAFEEPLSAVGVFFFFFPYRKLHENTKGGNKTKVQVSLDLIPEQVIFKNQKKTWWLSKQARYKRRFQCPLLTVSLKADHFLEVCPASTVQWLPQLQ